MATTKRRATKYQILLKAKSSFCKGKTTKAAFNKKAKAYIDDAVKKGNKTKTEANKTVSDLLKKSCTAKIGTSKKKSTKRKTTRRK